MALSQDSDRFEIHGPFAVGTEISVTPQGQDTFQSRITELVENEVYADQTSFGELTLLFRHTLHRLQDGRTRVTHRLVIDGPGADDAGPDLGPQISADFPAAMADLIAAARQLARQAGTDVKMTSQVLRKLEAKGLLQRGVDPHDSRAKRLRITPAGAVLARRPIVIVESVDAEVFGADAPALVAVLQRLSVAPQLDSPTPAG